MKNIVILMIMALFAAFQVQAQTAGEKAEKNCVKEKMNDRSTIEKVAGKVSSNIEKVQKGVADRDCRQEHADKVFENREKEFIDKYKDKPDRK